ncbi:MAG: hypothetical protein PHY02_06355 [Phycisphaerae bacterium]|nr:hypothetical protein [Phycisphaerae bacterium]
MVSRFEGHMIKAKGKVFAEFKADKPITFAPKVGEAFETEAILGVISGDIDSDDVGEQIIKSRPITIPLPAETVEYVDGIVTIEGEDWVVTEPGSISSGFVDLQCRYNRVTSKHGEMHKKRAT